MSITDTKTQYKTPTNFKSRSNLHAKYASQNWQLWLAQRIDIPDHSDVVDIGCGTGGFWRAAVDTYPESLSLTLLDSAEAMLDEAVKSVTSAGHYRAVRGVLANAMQLPFEGGRFDALCAMHMLYHLPDPAQALGEMRRVLRPGGCIAITTSGRDNLRALHALSAQVFGGAGVDPAAATFGPADAEALLADGFKDIKTEVLRDPYAVTDHRDVLNYLRSFPPASDASAGQLEQLEALIIDKMNAVGGVFHLRTQAAQITARA